MKKIKQILRNVFIKILHYFAKQCIVFESNPNYSDNTRTVYEELVHRKYNKKYYFLWIYKKEISYLDKKGHPHNLDIEHPKSLFEWLCYISYFDKQKCGICCNAFLDKYCDEKLFYLGHGGPYKATKGYYSIPHKIDYAISMADFLNPIIADQHNFDVKKIVGLGYPRNDILVNSNFDSKSVFGKKYLRIIVWYPTYRQHKSGFVTSSSKSIPLLDDVQNAQIINTTAKENDILILIKPHPAQDVSKVKKLQLSNIKFIDDSFFENNNTSSYEFIAGCDALLTDYSSVYYDYTLCDKPIGVVWEDIEEYKKFPGFAVDLDVMLKGAEKIYNCDELEKFIIDVANNKDNLREDRRKIRDLVNCSTDGKSTERVTDFIIEKAGL